MFVRVSEDCFVNSEKVQSARLDGCRIRISFGDGSYTEAIYENTEEAALAFSALRDELNGGGK